MQRVLSSSSMPKDRGGEGGGLVQGLGLGKQQQGDEAKGTVGPEKSPVVEVSVAMPAAASLLAAPPPAPVVRLKTGSLSSLTDPSDDPARKMRRRRGDWKNELQRIAVFIGVFSFIAWVTYLFLTKDE